jgi:hypothetical protein
MRMSLRLLGCRFAEALNQVNSPSIEDERQLALLTPLHGKAPVIFSGLNQICNVLARDAFRSRHVSLGRFSGDRLGELKPLRSLASRYDIDRKRAPMTMVTLGSL